MTNLELAKEQGSQAAPNVIDAAKAGEVQIDVTLAQEQGNQAAPLIADSLASSESYDAIKQQGNQAMPLIVDALAGGGSDTGFELFDFTTSGEGNYHIPYFVQGESGTYTMLGYGLLHDGYNLPDFTKLSVDNTEYDIYPMPDQEPPSTTGCYVVELYQELIDSQEIVDELKAVTGADVKIGDTLVDMQFVLITEQVLSGDVPFTLYADQDSWSGTLHEYVDTSANVYGGLDINSDSTTYELSVYTDNASNPYYKIGDDGEWTVYDSSNKPEFYLPGNYTIHLKATNDYDESEITSEFTFYISIHSKTMYPHIVENPSAMFAGLDIRVNIGSSYSDSELDGRNDIVFLYKEQSAVNWSSVAMTSTSDGYFAEVEIGWGNHVIDYKIQMDGVTLEENNYFYDAVPMSPSFDSYVLEDSNGNIGPFVKLHFGANYPDMNTVETIEYSFDDGKTWYDAVHDATLGCELAKVVYGEKTQYRHIHLKNAGLARTKLISDNTVKSQTADTYLNKITLLVGRNYEGAGKININNIETLLTSETEAYIDVLRPCDFKAEVIPDAGFVFERCYIWEDGSMSQQSTNNPSILRIPDDAPATVQFDAEIVQSSSADNS